MKFLLVLLLSIQVLFAEDATIEVVKKAQALPTLAIEDSSTSYSDTMKLKFFKALVADFNVLSIFNVDRHYRHNNYDASDVVVANKDMNYVVRYELVEDDSGAFNVTMKLLHSNNQVFAKKYKLSNEKAYVFVAHAMAYDINKFMGEDSVAWMKRKVIFSRVVAPRKTEIVLSDYTLTYQHVVVKGGFNVFPKWANEKQSAFYYSSLDGAKPSLKYVDMRTAQVKTILSSDGMIICSDVRDDGKKLLITMARNGQPDIYLYDVATHKYKRETFYQGIDVNGQFMDDTHIAFISSRLGYPNLFTKKLGTSGVEQLVYYGKNNSACSARGNYVVYKARETSNAFEKNTFNLHLISTKTDFIRRLTATGINEFPRFSRDGDAILFIKNYQRQSAIGVIRLKYNKNYLFPLGSGRIQSLDW